MINEYKAKKYCFEDISLIENYKLAIADKTQTWHCHHRLEVQGQFRNSIKLLKKCRLYYNRPASELIFLTKSKHSSLHNKDKKYSEEHRKHLSEVHRGKKHSEETKIKMSEARTGRKLSDETKEKLRKAHKGRKLSEEHKKHVSEALKGKKRGPFSKETKERLRVAHLGKPSWNKGVPTSEEAKEKNRQAHLGLHFWNNGSICVSSKEKPGTDFVPGRLKRP